MKDWENLVMRRHSSRYSSTAMAELNITPMLDLAFVLLIIFMISAPFLAERADLILPTSHARRDVIDPRQVVTVSANGGMALALEGEALDLATLQSRLTETYKEKPGTAVVLQAHHGLTLQEVTRILDVVKLSGISDIGLVTKPGAPSTPPTNPTRP